jgi:hypothetical protein
VFIKTLAKNSTFVQKETSSSITIQVNFTLTLDVNFILMFKCNLSLLVILIFLKAKLDNMKKQRKIVELFL